MRNYSMSREIENSCSHMRDSGHMQSEYVVGMAYVPWQYFTTVYETDKALEVGTIFPELDKPFWAGKGMCRR